MLSDFDRCGDLPANGVLQGLAYEIDFLPGELSKKNAGLKPGVQQHFSRR
jgi:hypothetical protein